MTSKSLTEYANDNLIAMMGMLNGMKFSGVQKNQVLSLIRIVASNAFRIGFQAASQKEITNDDFENLRYANNNFTSLEDCINEMYLKFTP